MNFLRFAITKHPILSGVFALALACLIFFGGRFAADAIYFSDPAHRQQTLEGWMTPKYVGMSWGLPKQVIDDVMNLDDLRGGRPPRVKDVAENLGISLEDLEARIRAAHDAHKAQRR